RLDARDESLECVLVAYAQAYMPDARRVVRRELQRVPLVVAPRTEVHRIARAPGLVQPDDRGEERETGLGLRREQLDVAKMSNGSETRKWQRSLRLGHWRIPAGTPYSSDARTSVMTSSTDSRRASSPCASATAIATSTFRRFASNPKGIDAGSTAVPAMSRASPNSLKSSRI